MPTSYDVLSDPLMRRHRATLFSRGCCLNIFSYLFVVIMSFYLAYATPGFWQKEFVYREQPEVTFKQRAIVTVQSGTVGTYKSWTSSSSMNALLGTAYTPMEVGVFPVDEDADGKNEYFDIRIRIPFEADDTNGIREISGALEFNVGLEERVEMEMSGLVFFRVMGPVDGRGMSLNGHFKLQEKNPILITKDRTYYQSSPLDFSPSNGLNDLVFPNLMLSYFNRNETLKLVVDGEVWLPGAAEMFEANMRIRNPPQRIYYHPTFWEMMKWAWVQFIAVYILVSYVWYIIHNWIVRNQVVPTRVVFDHVPKHHLE